MKKPSDSDRRGFFSPSGLSGPGYLMTGKDERTKRRIHYYVPVRSEEEGDGEARRQRAYDSTRARGIIPHSLKYVEERPAGYDATTGLPDATLRRKLAFDGIKWGVRCFFGCLPPLLIFLGVVLVFIVIMAWISPPDAGLSPFDRQMLRERTSNAHREPSAR